MKVLKFRKKPVIIEAMHFKEVCDGSIICTWCGGTNEVSPHEIQIHTLEGVMTANLGDWIIKGLMGEFYPCKNAVFVATYEPAE